MSKFTTHKSTAQGKRQTLARRKVRAVKAGALTVTRSNRARKVV